MNERYQSEEANIASRISGVLVIDKPIGMTSHDVVQAVRAGTHIRRAGHAGTLDPRASGVLVVLLGPSVRLSEYVSASEKRYQAIIQLGITTDSYDLESPVKQRKPVDIGEEELQEALKDFIGTFEQQPPAYSAIKVAGRKAYDMARNGEEVSLEPREVTVHDIELLEWDAPELIIDVQCSSGTYIRSLANDLGERLGCGGTLTGLRRTKSGQFGLRNAVPLRKLQDAFTSGEWYQYIIPASEALGDWYKVDLDEVDVDEIRHGHRILAKEEMEAGKWARGVDGEGELIALLEYVPDTKEWQPKKVFFQ
ncbi:MAG: tRNA pseudouridine(55) synthase TruB [Anaerolineaceae bacterium]|nr:tRNA pseudouridine(55) synthase TruB [Anaerolineaceae bacterium]